MLRNDKFHNLIEAVVHIAIHAKPNAVRGPEICKALGLPERYLESDLQKLVHRGILRSVRGPKGGYVLASERRNITLADIYAGVNEGGEKNKGDYISLTLEVAEKKYFEELGKITIESLCLKAGQSGDGRQKPDFAI